MSELPIAIRMATNEDYGYILKTWSIDFHKTFPTTFIPNSIYVPHQTKIINNILAVSHVEVACIDDEPDTICGYLISQPINTDNVIIHWGQTKGIFRRMGIMKELLKSIQVSSKNIICSHHFHLFKEMKDKFNLIYDPTLIESFQ